MLKHQGVSRLDPKEKFTDQQDVICMFVYYSNCPINIIENKMLRVRASKKQETIDKEEIINYEYKMIELSLPLVQPVISNTSKYVPWELDNKIKETIGSIPHTVRWVGCSETAYLETYAYIMLMGTGQSQTNILEFKYTVYKLGRKCLQLAQQKLLVQFLCLIEYSRDKYSFLNKYPQIQAIFIKILQYLEQEHTNSDDSAPEQTRKAKVRRRLKAHSGDSHSPRSQSLSQQLQYERELQQIYRTFSNYFQFISLLGSNEFSCTFRLFDTKKIHLVIEKDCYFMVQPIDPDHHQYTFGIKPPKSDRRGSQQPPSLVDSSNGNFDKKEFLDIFNYKSEVEQSKVISVQRGSQIRKPHVIIDTLGITTPKFPYNSLQAFPCPQEFQIQKNQQKLQHDRTFIDQLLNNVVMQPQEQQKTQKYDKMKGILAIKQELKRVQMRIQDKIKQFDQIRAYQKPSDLKINRFPINPTSEKLETSKEKPSQKQFKTNLVKESVVRKHEVSMFIKKQRKTSYNSVKIIPYNYNFTKNQQNAEVQSPIPTSPKNRDSAKPIYRVDRMLSQKAISRPHSNLKPLLQQENKKHQRSRSPEPVIHQQYKMRSFSPKNVNVNVNVNINENLISPIPYKDSSFPMPYKQIYHKKQNNQGHFSSQYYIPPHLQKQYDAKGKAPHFLERLKSKVNNAEGSFIKSGNINVVLNNK